MKPQRIQRKRTKGFKLPPNTVCVTRPGKWGNPWKVGEKFGGAKGDCVKYFRAWIEQTEPGKRLVEEARSELRGKNLACWCKVGEPCHADILLEISNGDDHA